MTYKKEEKYILKALEDGKIKLSKPSKKEIESIKAAANNTFKKDRRITIRLYNHDFIGIQKKAIEMGLPYQTLISGIIHRYIEGDIKIKPHNNSHQQTQKRP
jgi:predicted DNA binding CopG/RHH family protein